MNDILKRTLVKTTFFASMLIFAGCGNEVKSIDYYKAHMDEAKVVKEECDKKKNDGSMEANPLNPSNEFKDCMNASHALFFNGGKKPIHGNEKSVKTWKE